MGADCILLIVSALDKTLLKNLYDAAKVRDLDVIVEVHDYSELESALEIECDIIGINNRNLDTLKIDLNTTKKILENTECSKIVISESGIESEEDIRFLHKCGAKGYLIGTAIMKNDNMEQTVRGLVNSI